MTISTRFTRPILGVLLTATAIAGLGIATAATANAMPNPHESVTAPAAAPLDLQTYNISNHTKAPMDFTITNQRGIPTNHTIQVGEKWSPQGDFVGRNTFIGRINGQTVFSAQIIYSNDHQWGRPVCSIRTVGYINDSGRIGALDLFTNGKTGEYGQQR